MRTLVAAVVLALAAPAFADAQQHAQAARKAERRGEWKKALEEWKVAYRQDVNAEFLVAIGDAQAKLGQVAEAKKSYQAYLADPLALPSNVEKVKRKLAALDTPARESLALPGPGLTLPGADAPPPANAAAKKAAPALDLPGAQVAKADPLPLPGLDLPSAAPKSEKKVATSSPGLDLPLPGLPQTKPAQPESKPAVAKAEPQAAQRTATTQPGKVVAIASPPAERKSVPQELISPMPTPRSQGSSASKTVAWASAVVAVAALGGGAYAYTKGSSSASELTNGSIRSGAANQALMDDANRNKTLGFVGLAGGLVAAGLSAALFAF